MLQHKKIYTALCAFLMITACGFEPLYVERKTEDGWYYKGEFDTSITDEMEKIRIEPISDRFGQLLRNNLLDSFTPKGTPANPRYRLVIGNIDKQVVQQALRDDITATRERVRYKVYYYLYDNESNKQLVRGNSMAYVSYDILANPYSTTFAQKKTEQNAADIIANDISLRMGASFHSIMTKASKK